VRTPLVAVTRPATVDDPLGLALAAGGADVLWLPTTAVRPPLDPRPLATAVAGVSDFDWLVFTSGHAVHAVCTHPAWPASRPSPGATRPRVAAVGERTADRLARQGVRVDLVAPSAGAAGLAAAVVAEEGGSLEGRRVLWPRSDIARRELADGLAAAGARVHEAVAYRTVTAIPAEAERFRDALAGGQLDAVCFLSPSAAEGLVTALGGEDLARLRGRCLVASLGPATSEALLRLGAPADVEAHPPSAAALAAAVLARLAVPQGVTR